VRLASPGNTEAKAFKEEIMKCLRPTRAWLVGTVLTVLLMVTVAGAAKTGREFSGYFDVSDLTRQGDFVQVTLHLQLFNHSEADVKSVIVTLMQSGPSLNLIGSFQPVSVWKSQHFIEMSQQFTVPERDLREWMAAQAPPNLVILFQDSKGRSWQKGAQLSRRPLAH
jgi:hypothetical protein